LYNYKQQAVDLLKSIETGDTNPLAYINPNKYVQHNLAVGDGLAGVTTPNRKGSTLRESKRRSDFLTWSSDV